MQLKWPMLWDLFSLFPAHAGVIPQERAYITHSKAFPRTRGGDPDLIHVDRHSVSLFPAHAGVIPEWLEKMGISPPFPRTRGGDPFEQWAATAGENFSPHTRG